MVAGTRVRTYGTLVSDRAEVAKKKTTASIFAFLDDDNERPRGSASGDKESRHILIQSSDWASHRSNHIFRVVERRGTP
jgi:hypothetical protein